MRKRIIEGVQKAGSAGLTGDHPLDHDFGRLEGKRPPTAAAVLIPIVEHRSGMTVLLTQRTDHLYDHAGQVSFPGGRVESHDLDPIETALRETEEEIGLSRRHVEVVGRIEDYITGTGFQVTPVVGLIAPGFVLNPDPFEVAEVFEVPLDFLLDPANHQVKELTYKGLLRQYYAMPYNGHYIWGATAGMIVNFAKRIRG